jgi:hypothetical protein
VKRIKKRSASVSAPSFSLPSGSSQSFANALTESSALEEARDSPPVDEYFAAPASPVVSEGGPRADRDSDEESDDHSFRRKRRRQGVDDESVDSSQTEALLKAMRLDESRDRASLIREKSPFHLGRLSSEISRIPSNISINQHFLTLSKGEISSDLAQKFLNQARMPGFNESFQIPTLIFDDALFVITSRLLSRTSEDWSTWLPSLSEDQISIWYEHSDVLTAANLVYSLFGPNSINQTSTKSLDALVREARFGWDLNDECFEDAVFLKLHNLIRLHSEPNMSSERSLALSVMISARLPLESEVTTAYKQALERLSPSEKLLDTPDRVCRRIKIALSTARSDIRKAFCLMRESRQISEGSS